MCSYNCTEPRSETKPSVSENRHPQKGNQLEGLNLLTVQYDSGTVPDHMQKRGVPS